METKIIELIVTTEKKGTGKEDSPFRLLMQLYTKEGILIAQEGTEYDEPVNNLRGLFKTKYLK